MIFLFTFLLVLYWFIVISVTLIAGSAAVAWFIDGMENHKEKDACIGAFLFIVILTCAVYFSRNGYILKASRYLNQKATPVEVQPEKQ